MGILSSSFGHNFPTFTMRHDKADPVHLTAEVWCKWNDVGQYFQQSDEVHGRFDLCSPNPLIFKKERSSIGEGNCPLTPWLINEWENQDPDPGQVGYKHGALTFTVASVSALLLTFSPQKGKCGPSRKETPTLHFKRHQVCQHIRALLYRVLGMGGLEG